MNKVAKRLKRGLQKIDFYYNPINETFKRVKSFTGLSSIIYTYNHKIDICTGTLDLSWWEDGYNVETYTDITPDASVDYIVSLLKDN